MEKRCESSGEERKAGDRWERGREEKRKKCSR
jgi:hypothetical protein